MGIFDDYDSAVAAKSKATEDAKEPETCTTSQSGRLYKGVVRISGGMFQAQHYDHDSQTMKYLGSSTSAKGAAQLIAEYKGLELPKIKLKNTKRFGSDECMERFRLCMLMYTDMDGTPALMSDLVAAADDKIQHPLLSVTCPALYLISLMGKDGPWKAALARRWKQSLSLTARESSFQKMSTPSLLSLRST